MDRFGHDIFSMLRMKGHVLHRTLAHLKVEPNPQLHDTHERGTLAKDLATLKKLWLYPPLTFSDDIRNLEYVYLVKTSQTN